ncbi:hypothetical protein BHE74_00009050 [Ensete ventricosum]|nr:hypothetical protein BHE74_00009050 [Ensete ventricosum]
MEAKYLSAHARSSTSHSSRIVYPCSGTSSSSTTHFPFSIEVLVVLPESYVGCSRATFQRHFLIPAPSPVLGHFSAVDALTSTTTSTLAVDGIVNPLPTLSSDFIFPRFNISTQRKLFTVQDIHSIMKL